MHMQKAILEKRAPAISIDLSRFKFETDRIRKEWDHHGSYQWTYFVEEQKRLISFFLSKRAGPRNLEIGGGWYQSYPGSTAIDVSKVCLKYNEARKKVQYDLDYITACKLPFKDHSFDSATMISVLQYLQDPAALLKELERVLAPGGEVYVINGQGAGVEGLVKSASRSESILELAMQCGYDAMLQTIPEMDGKRDTFKSVCIAMPDDTLFGKKSKIIDKRKRARRLGSAKEFLGGYVEWELGKIMERLWQLRTYPITEYSRHYLEACENASQAFSKKTGRFPVLYSESHQIEVDMYVAGGFMMSHELMMDISSNKEPFNDFAKAFGIGFSGYYGSSLNDYIRKHLEGKDILPEIRSDWERAQERDGAIYSLASFIASIPLNSHTKSLQQSLLEKLEKEEPTAKKVVGRARARHLYSLCYEYKQRRSIDKLIKTKGGLNGTEIASEASLDIGKELPYFRNFILEIPMSCDDSGMD